MGFPLIPIIISSSNYQPQPNNNPREEKISSKLDDVPEVVGGSISAFHFELSSSYKLWKAALNGVHTGLNVIIGTCIWGSRCQRFEDLDYDFISCRFHKALGRDERAAGKGSLWVVM